MLSNLCYRVVFEQETYDSRRLFRSSLGSGIDISLIAYPFNYLTDFQLYNPHYYRPQRKVMFSEASVSHSVHRGYDVTSCFLSHVLSGGGAYPPVDRPPK